MRIYLTGGDGMLGRELRAALARTPATAGWPVEAVSAHDFDIGDAAALRASVRAFRPDVLVHTAAHAIVEDCEADPTLAMRVNVAGTHHVAEVCRELSSRLVYISSDYVFDGIDPPPGGYPEDSVPNPVSLYGLTKLAGERIVATVADHLVVRTSWLFGGPDPGTDPVLALIRDAADGIPAALVADQYSSPTYTADLAEALVGVLAAAEPPTGVLHIANGGRATWHDVGTEVVAQLRRTGLPDAPEPRPAPLAEFGFRGRRPIDSALATARLDALGRSLPHWSDAVGRYCAELQRTAVAEVAR